MFNIFESLWYGPHFLYYLFFSSWKRNNGVVHKRSMCATLQIISGVMTELNLAELYMSIDCICLLIIIWLKWSNVHFGVIAYTYHWTDFTCYSQTCQYRWWVWGFYIYNKSAWGSTKNQWQVVYHLAGKWWFCTKKNNSNLGFYQEHWEGEAYCSYESLNDWLQGNALVSYPTSSSCDLRSIHLLITDYICLMDMIQ